MSAKEGGEYTEEERRNLATLDRWVHGWNTPGLAGMMVDELYAESCEVYTPLQNRYWLVPGESKDDWREVEVAYEEAIESREMTVVAKVAKGDMIGVEVKTRITAKSQGGQAGETHHSGFMAFLWFEDGRIVRDHTYQRPPSFMTPRLEAAIRKIRDKRKAAAG